MEARSPGRRLGVTRLAPVTAASGRVIASLEQIRPLYVVGAFVVAEWLATLALALTVRHNGWLFYQGGDQVWFYTTSWLLKHGQLAPAYVGYGWSVLLMPFTLFGGPNLLQALPAIVLLNVLVLMPVAMAAMYGIGERLGGRLFGYWVLLLWLVVPFIGIRYADAGYHQRYTELSLPGAFGLTAQSDFPSMVMLAVSAYFCVRALQRSDWTDGLLAGLFAGFGIGIKPASSLFLGGVALALLSSRRWRAAAAFSAGLAPCIATLTFWKWRGLGYVPLFHAEDAVRLAAAHTFGRGPAAVSIHLSKYINLNWTRFSTNLGSLREHFWSARVVEWLVIAGILAWARRSLAAFLLVGGWFAAFLIVKGTDPLGSLEDSTLLRMLIPAIPAFVLMLAALPLLLPGVPRRLPVDRAPRPWGTSRLRLSLVVAAVVLFSLVPAALAAASHRLGTSAAAFSEEAGPIPTDSGLHVRAAVEDGSVRLAWSPQREPGGRVFYQILRTPVPGPCGPNDRGSYTCLSQIGSTAAASYADRPPRSGTYDYRVTVAANWQNDLSSGDGYVASQPVVVKVP